jgi:chromosome segregation ATPase
VEELRERAKDHTSSLQSSVSAKEKLEADLEAAQTALTDWAAKAAAWDAERNRHKTQTARNSALIGQFQAELTSLKIKLREVEGERDAFKSERDTFKGERDSFKEAEVKRKGRRDALQIKAKEAQQQLDGAKKAEAELDSALEMEAEIELELGGVKAAASSAAPTAASASPVSPALPKAMFIRRKWAGSLPDRRFC